MSLEGERVQHGWGDGGAWEEGREKQSYYLS